MLKPSDRQSRLNGLLHSAVHVLIGFDQFFSRVILSHVCWTFVAMFAWLLHYFYSHQIVHSNTHSSYRLQLLDLSRNQLEGFDDTHVLKLQKIKDVKLENNPLICDRCHMGTLIDIARRVSGSKDNEPTRSADEKNRSLIDWCTVPFSVYVCACDFPFYLVWSRSY